MSRYQRYNEGCWWRVSGEGDVYFFGNGVPQHCYSMADLTNYQSLIDTIKFTEPALSKENWGKACAFIHQSTSLKSITFCKIGSDDRNTYNYLASVFSTSEHNICPSLCAIEIALPRKELFRRRHLGIVIDFMKTHPNTVWTLDLGDTTLGDGCIGVITNAMNSGLRLRSLKLRGEFVGDNDVESLLSTNSAKYLQELDVSSNEMTRAGFEVLTSFLGQDSTSIEKLDARSQVTSDIEYSRLLLEAISTNNNSPMQSVCLRKLCNQERNNDDLKPIVAMLKNMICKPPDIKSLCKSNHQLYNIGYSTPYLKTHSKVIRMALDINERQVSVNQKHRMKIRAFYFTQADFDIKPFLDMDVELMPNVLELVTMSKECITDEQEGRLKRDNYVSARNGHLGGIYRLVRNCHVPELFNFQSQQAIMEQQETRISELEKRVEQLTLQLTNSNHSESPNNKRQRSD